MFQTKVKLSFFTLCKCYGRRQQQNYTFLTLTLSSMGVGGRCTPPGGHLLKKSLGIPYLKNLNFSLLYVADASMYKKNQNTFGTPNTKIDLVFLL